jgi:hypothetical protein
VISDGTVNVSINPGGAPEIAGSTMIPDKASVQAAVSTLHARIKELEKLHEPGALHGMRCHIAELVPSEPCCDWWSAWSSRGWDGTMDFPGGPQRRVRFCPNCGRPKEAR